MGQGSICKEDVTTSFLKNDEVSDGEDDTQVERRVRNETKNLCSWYQSTEEKKLIVIAFCWANPHS